MLNYLNADEIKKYLAKYFSNGCNVSFNYKEKLENVFKHLVTLYGEDLSPAKCLDDYYKSIEYRNHAHVINKCSDLELIDEEDIKNLFKEEENFNKLVQELLSLKDDETTSGTLKKADILGLLPNQNSNTIYKNILSGYNFTQSNIEQIRTNIDNNIGTLNVVVSILLKLFLDGYYIEVAENQGVILQRKSRYLYRGENAYYKKSQASIFRESAENKLMPPNVVKVLKYLRLLQAEKEFNEIYAVIDWPYCQPNDLALAQHYGIKSPVLDITSNLKTALFFACCKYNYSEKKWLPLDDSEFNLRSSRSYIHPNLNGNSRYGVLYRIPSEITDYHYLSRNNNFMDEVILPIGYQPFLRCKSQHGYMMLTNGNYDLLRDKRFDKFRFKLTNEICQGIYDEMDQGNKIYPNTDIPDVDDEIEKINSQMVFSRDVFNDFIDIFKYPKSQRKAIEEDLKSYNIHIVNDIKIFSESKIDMINHAYPIEKSLELNNTKPLFFPQVTIW